MKNENDVRILQKIIAEQNGKGATLPVRLDSWRYFWNKDGRLIGIDWNGCGLKGSLSLAGLDLLKTLDCSGCFLETLDISHNPELKWLNCEGNSLDSLDTRANQLEYLRCDSDVHVQQGELQEGANLMHEQKEEFQTYWL